jgi:hypothetical protein
MSQLRVYRPDLTDEQPRTLSFAFHAPLIRAERVMAVLREARLRHERMFRLPDYRPETVSLRLFDGRFGR